MVCMADARPWVVVNLVFNSLMNMHIAKKSKESPQKVSKVSQMGAVHRVKW